MVKEDKSKNANKSNKTLLISIGIFIVAVVFYIITFILNSNSDDLSNGSSSDSSAIKDVTRLVESNESDINRELGVYMLGSSGNVQRVNSANCSIKDSDSYGRYILYCSIDYTGHTTGSGIDKSGNSGVYVGYLNTGDGKFNYKIGSTYSSSGDALKYLESKICWNSNSSNMVCN